MPLVNRFRTSNLQTDLTTLAGPDSRIVFDVGANVGQSAAAFAAMFPDASIFAFEPLPSSCQTLRMKAIPRVEIIEAAVGVRSGLATLHINADPQTNSLLVPNLAGRRLFPSQLAETDILTVQLVALDDFRRQKQIELVDLLKIDVQGAELQVLNGAERTLSHTRIIQVEVNFIPQYEESATFGEVDTLLRRHGWSYYNMYQLWRDNEHGRIVFANCLYFNPALVSAPS